MEQYATTIRKLEEQRTSLNANLTHERAKNQRLTEALKEIAEGAPAAEDQSWYEGKDTPYYAERRTHYGFAKIARAALAKWKEQE